MTDKKNGWVVTCAGGGIITIALDFLSFQKKGIPGHAITVARSKKLATVRVRLG